MIEISENTSNSDDSVKHQQVTKEFLRIVNDLRIKHDASPMSLNTALKFLMARKFDLNRALALYDAHESTRFREGLTNFDPEKEPLKSELESGKFTVLVSIFIHFLKSVVSLILYFMPYVTLAKKRCQWSSHSHVHSL